MPTNRYAGSCNNCGQHVEAGQGNLRLEGTGWKVYCPTPCQRRPDVVRNPTIESRVGDLTGIMGLFTKAKTHLKMPAIVVGRSHGADRRAGPCHRPARPHR